MNTKTMKILITLVSMVIMIAMLGTVVCAADPVTTPGGMEANVEGTGDISTLGSKLMGILQTVGIVVSVLILMVLGIKYMMGSAEEKAEYKKTMIPYIIGAILIFGASTIANMVFNFATALKG